MLVAIKNYNIGLQYDYWTYNIVYMNIGLGKACTYPIIIVRYYKDFIAENK